MFCQYSFIYLRAQRKKQKQDNQNARSCCNHPLMQKLKSNHERGGRTVGYTLGCCVELTP